MTKHDDWKRFCDRHRAYVERLGKVAIAFRSADRFTDLLQLGATTSKSERAELAALTEPEWAALCAFASHFSCDWQSYFVETLYPAYFREHQRRGTSHQWNPQQLIETTEGET